ncbi:hypothetical protein BH11PSE8_BH11PSE8_23030 [soil metagenome]
MDKTGIAQMDRAAFVEHFGGIFEHSPWVAERAFDARPFADGRALHAAMVGVVEAEPRERQVALLCAHPDLAGKEASEGSMTSSSVAEQSSAGLDRLSKAELQRIGTLNAEYRARHGFPFIIVVRHYTKEGILHEFERRLASDTATELRAALAQVYAITWLRVQRLLTAEPTSPIRNTQGATA